MTESDSLRMSLMITGAWISQIVYVVAKLDLADRIAENPRTSDQLARETGTHPQAMARLLRASSSLGVFRIDETGKYHLTSLAESLRGDVPGSQKALAIMMGEEHYRCWGELLYSVRTGKKAFDHLYGQPIFEYLGQHPEQARIFDAAMTSVHGRESRPMAKAYNFSQFETLADIGGGNGSLLIEILREHPGVNGILYDLPGVIDRTRANVEQAGMSDRIELIPGNFFESIPAGADAYLMRHIIHDWNDEQCGTILGNVRQVIGPDGKLLIAESVIPDGDEPFFGKLLDLTMLLLPGGQERTEEEYRHLLQTNGFDLTQVVPTASEVSFIEGIKASN